MGNQHALYGRRKDNERYTLVVNRNKNYMNSFKHDVAAYALDRKHKDLKSLYIYKGYIRQAKAIVYDKYLEITFLTAKLAEAWDSSEEDIQDVPWLFRDFNRKWKPVHIDASYKRVYQQT